MATYQMMLLLTADVVSGCVDQTFLYINLSARDHFRLDRRLRNSSARMNEKYGRQYLIRITLSINLRNPCTMNGLLKNNSDELNIHWRASVDQFEKTIDTFKNSMVIWSTQKITEYQKKVVVKPKFGPDSMNRWSAKQDLKKKTCTIKIKIQAQN